MERISCKCERAYVCVCADEPAPKVHCGRPQYTESVSKYGIMSGRWPSGHPFLTGRLAKQHPQQPYVINLKSMFHMLSVQPEYTFISCCLLPQTRDCLDLRSNSLGL
jgi:hypothetical protein